VDGGSLALECGCGQAPALVGELAAAGFGEAGVDPDLAGIERVVWARWR
jgi:methylase of polypeptide subunit release factors